MSEPEHDLRTTPSEASDDLAAMADAGIVRGVMIFAITDAGAAYYTLGGWITQAEVERTITVLQTMMLNGVEVNKLMGMEAKGHG